MSNTLIATIVISGFLVGGLLSLPQKLFVTLQAQLSLHDRRISLLHWVYLLSLMGLLALSGLVVENWGTQETLIIGSLMVCFGIASLALNGVSAPAPKPSVSENSSPLSEDSSPPADKVAPVSAQESPPLLEEEKPARGNFGMIIVSLLFLAGGTALLHTSTAVSMAHAFFPETEAIPPSQTQIPAATNLGYLFVGVGILVFPYLLSFLIEKLQFRNGMLLVALFTLLPSMAAMFSGNHSFPTFPAREDFSALFSQWNLWMVVVAVLFFYALESSLVFWAPKYLEEIGYNEQGKWILLAFFWAFFLGGRVLGSLFMGLDTFSWILLITTFLAGITLGNMVGIYQKGSGGISFLFLGLCLGPIFPTMVGLIFLNFQTHSASAFGLICGIGTAGRFLFQPLVENRVAHNQFRFAMALSMVMALLVAITVLVLALVRE